MFWEFCTPVQCDLLKPSSLFSLLSSHHFPIIMSCALFLNPLSPLRVVSVGRSKGLSMKAWTSQPWRLYRKPTLPPQQPSTDYFSLSVHAGKFLAPWKLVSRNKTFRWLPTWIFYIQWLKLLYLQGVGSYIMFWRINKENENSLKVDQGEFVGLH